MCRLGQVGVEKVMKLFCVSEIDIGAVGILYRCVDTPRITYQLTK